jgi:hypothetical protein
MAFPKLILHSFAGKGLFMQTITGILEQPLAGYPPLFWKIAKIKVL